MAKILHRTIAYSLDSCCMDMSRLLRAGDMAIIEDGNLRFMSKSNNHNISFCPFCGEEIDPNLPTILSEDDAP